MTTATDKLLAVCEETYRRTREVYAAARCVMGGGACGFSILYGPPILHPRILFVGYQPGGGVSDGAVGEAEGNHDGWPPDLVYRSADWRLAREVRAVYPDEMLRRSVALNAIFFRSPNASRFSSLPPKLRRDLTAFSVDRARELIDAMAPEQVVAIGFKALDLLGRRVAAIRGPSGRVIAYEGRMGGPPALAVLHLTGCHISHEDRAEIRGLLRKAAGLPKS